MTDFDKLTYWKQRINDQIMGLFSDVKVRLKGIKNNMDHIGADPEEVKQAIALIGEGLEALKGSADHVVALKREAK